MPMGTYHSLPFHFFCNLFHGALFFLRFSQCDNQVNEGCNHAEHRCDREDLVDLPHLKIRHGGDFDYHGLSCIQLAALKDHIVENDQCHIHNDLCDSLSTGDLCRDSIHGFHTEVCALHGDARGRNQHSPDIGILAELHVPAESAHSRDRAQNNIGNDHTEHHRNQDCRNRCGNVVNPLLQKSEYLIDLLSHYTLPNHRIVPFFTQEGKALPLMSGPSPVTIP